MNRTRVRVPPDPPIKKPTLLKWVFFFRKYPNYLTEVVSFTTSVALVVDSTAVASGVAFPVPFSPQDVIREIVVKIVKEIKNNFFILNKV
jgi:hypothetical protein